MEIGKIEQLSSDPEFATQTIKGLLGKNIKARERLMTINCNPEVIMGLLIETDADWTEVLRFLEFVAGRQNIHLDTQKIAEMVAERLGGF